MINQKMQKYANLKFLIEKEHGFEIERSYDNNYQIVVKSPCGDLVDFYTTTGTFIFRNEGRRGKGFVELAHILDSKRRSVKSRKERGADNYLTLKIELDDLEVDEIVDSVSKEFIELREAKPQNFLEKIAMKYLKKRHYKIID